MKETIFYCTLENKTKKMHRMTYFDGEKTLEDFMNWISKARTKVEKELNEDVFVSSTNFIKNTKG